MSDLDCGVSGMPRLLLRLEGAVMCAASGLAYEYMNQSWLLFALLFLTPDLSMLGYLKNPRFGAACYNVGHSYIGPAVLALAGVLIASPWLLPLALIWIAHIGLDRLLGFGLKYNAAFEATHLGTVSWIKR